MNLDEINPYYFKLQDFVENINAMASVYSFDILPDGSYGNIKLVALNRHFLGLTKRNPDAPPFRPGISYKYYFNNSNFESFCYKCATENEALYSYVNTYGIWLSGFYLPVESDSKDRAYCCYILKYSKEVDSDEMSKRTAEVSSAVLNMSIKLHKNRDFIKSISEVSKDIRKICCSEKCSVVLVDSVEKKCSFINETGEHEKYMRQIAEDMNCTPYEMAMVWEKSLRGTDCFLFDDISKIKKYDIEWYNSLCKNGVQSLVLYAVRFNNELVGFIWSANFNASDMMRIKETLEATSFFIGSVIANH